MSHITKLPPPPQLVDQDISRLDASSRLMLQAAQSRSIECVIMPDYKTILMTKNNQSWYTRGSRTSFQSAIGQTIANNKAITKQFLTAYNIPTAKAVRVAKSSELEHISQLAWPLVMKPTLGTYGRGVVIGLNSLEEARTAWQNSSEPVLFEETLQGTEYRIVCVDFKFVAAAFRKPAHVVGDGNHTIAELIALKNQHPDRAEGHRGNLSLITVDAELERIIGLQNLNLDSVPTADQEVVLRKTANLSTGGEARNVTDQVCAENQALFEHIARICDLNVIGIDVMCADLKTPMINQPKAGVIEINKSPGLRMHHHPSVGESIDVASKILDMTEQSLT